MVQRDAVFNVVQGRPLHQPQTLPPTVVNGRTTLTSVNLTVT